MVPKSYKEITVEKYQEIYPILQLVNQLEGLDSLDQWVNIISILSGKSIEEIEQLDLDLIKSYIKQLSFLKSNEYKLVYKYIWIKGSLYKAVNKAELLNTAQYVAIKEFLKDGKMVENLEHLAACSYKKFKIRHVVKQDGKQIVKWFVWAYEGHKHNYLIKEFKKMNCHKVLPIVFFCSKVYKYWMENTEAYLNSQKILKERMAEINQLISEGNFINIMGGMPQSTKSQEVNLG